MRSHHIVIVALLVVLVPLSASAWGGRTHVAINRIATMIVPDEMEGWEAYADILAGGGYLPDLWKGDDPEEGPRHYIDVESYQGIDVENLPRDYAETAESLRGKKPNGIAPWVILELQSRLTGAMASNDWLEAAAVAAAMGHYVGDTHQPLHTTEHYDGATAISRGVHKRWEMTMPTRYMKKGLLRPHRDGEYLPDVWPVILEWVGSAHEKYDDILEADAVAATASGGNVESIEYYDELWDQSGQIFLDQVIESSHHLADLWYTAWVDAGRPAIPSPPPQISETTIWAPRNNRQTPSSWPFFVVFIVVSLVVVILSYRRRPA